MQNVRPLFRVVALIGCIVLSLLSPPAWALREPSFSEMNPEYRISLEQTLKSGAEEVLFEGSVEGKEWPSFWRMWRESDKSHFRSDRTKHSLEADVLKNAVDKVLWRMFQVLQEKIWQKDPRWSNFLEIREVGGGDFHQESLEKYRIDDVLYQDILRHPTANAVDAVMERWGSGAGSKIQIRSFVDRKKEELWIQILDNGNGIPPEILGQIGKKEVTSKRMDAPSLGAFGQGLFWATDHANRRGWQLVVANRSDTRGASVSLKIPLDKGPSKSTGMEEIRVEVAVHDHMLDAVRARFGNLPNLTWRPVSANYEAAAEQLQDFIAQEGIRRVVILDELYISEWQANSILPEGHAPVVIVDAGSADQLTPEYLTQLLRLPEVSAGRIYFLRFEKDRLKLETEA